MLPVDTTRQAELGPRLQRHLRASRVVHTSDLHPIPVRHAQIHRIARRVAAKRRVRAVADEVCDVAVSRLYDSIAIQVVHRPCAERERLEQRGVRA